MCVCVCLLRLLKCCFASCGCVCACEIASFRGGVDSHERRPKISVPPHSSMHGLYTYVECDNIHPILKDCRVTIVQTNFNPDYIIQQKVAGLCRCGPAAGDDCAHVCPAHVNLCLFLWKLV